MSQPPPPVCAQHDFAAVPDVAPPIFFNSGFMLLKPSAKTVLTLNSDTFRSPLPSVMSRARRSSQVRALSALPLGMSSNAAIVWYRTGKMKRKDSWWPSHQEPVRVSVRTTLCPYRRPTVGSWVLSTDVSFAKSLRISLWGYMRLGSTVS